MISIHASAKEATWCPPFFWPLVHFNPRLREGGDVRHNLLYLVIKISIHASAKEATYFHPDCCFGVRFQSTPPRRRRRKFVHVVYIPKKISIHASAKEATIDTDGSKRYYWGFQSTPPRRRRRTSVFRSMPLMVFQSTPPRRRRPQHIVIPQLSCTYLVSTTFLSTIFSFISQYVVLFFLF